jgi:hypothetical protein
LQGKQHLFLVALIAALAGPAVGFILWAMGHPFLSGGIGLLVTCVVAIVGAYVVSRLPKS